METKVEIPLLVHTLELIFKPRSFRLSKIFSTFWPWDSPCDHSQCEMVLKKNVTSFPQFLMTRADKDLPWELRTWACCASVLLASSPNPLWKRQAFPSPTNITNSGFEFTQCQLLRPNANSCGMLRSKLTLTFHHLRTQNLADSRRQLWRQL